jgi:DNA-binding LytR/AlgR family response regulator
MPTALIAEDEPMLLAQLKARLAVAWPELEIVAEAANGEEALALANEARPDIAFLDIRMPILSGLEVARELAPRCHVVFVTAYDEYAVSAFDEGAIDYVLKPPMPEKIAKVVARLKSRIAQAPLDLTALLAKLAARDEGAAPLKWIRASLGASMRMIRSTTFSTSAPRTNTRRSSRARAKRSSASRSRSSTSRSILKRSGRSIAARS